MQECGRIKVAGLWGVIELGIFSKISSFFTGKKELAPVTAESLSDALIAADIAPDLAESLVSKLRARGTVDAAEAKQILFDAMLPIANQLAVSKEQRANYDKNNKVVNEANSTIADCSLLTAHSKSPTVILIIGVNGAGKTTTIGKLARQWVDAGKKVIVGACDTFRAAAGEQLTEWVRRAGATLIDGELRATPIGGGSARSAVGGANSADFQNSPPSAATPPLPPKRGETRTEHVFVIPAQSTPRDLSRGDPGARTRLPTCDPASVAYQAVERGIAENADIVLLDTAGRLHNRADLMDELAKINRVIKKVLPDAPHETWLVLDAMTGQNATAQIEYFNNVAPLTGLIVTKMDSTSKGGFLISYASGVGANHIRPTNSREARNKKGECDSPLPIIAIGYGEKIHDLRPFDADEYLKKLLDL